MAPTSSRSSGRAPATSRARRSPTIPTALDNPVFRSLNRNKRSIALDLRKPDGKAIIYDLVREADVVANNFRAGVMERMGFGYDELAKINPRIICAFGSGFGQTGPLAYKGGQDILAQALSGVMRRKCNDDEPLTVYATSLCDYTAGMHLVQAILLALLQREKTGRGQQVAVSLFESMLAMQMQEAAMWLQRGRHFSWGAYPLTGGFETTDGAIVLVGAFKTNPLHDICAALGLPDLSADPRYATFEAQVAHKSELQAIFRERFAVEQHRTLAGPPRRAGPAVRAGADAGRGARPRTDQGQRDSRHDCQAGGGELQVDRHAARHGAEGASAAPSAAGARRRQRRRPGARPDIRPSASRRCEARR